MTPQNTPASDEAKAEKVVQENMEGASMCCSTCFRNAKMEEVISALRYGFHRGLREARTESLSEISNLRELLERAIPFIQQLVNDYAPSETKKERKILADYAALTKGEKND